MAHRHADEDGHAAGFTRQISSKDCRLRAEPRRRVRACPRQRPQLQAGRPNQLLHQIHAKKSSRLRSRQTGERFRPTKSRRKRRLLCRQTRRTDEEVRIDDSRRRSGEPGIVTGLFSESVTAYGFDCECRGRWILTSAKIHGRIPPWRRTGSRRFSFWRNRGLRLWQSNARPAFLVSLMWRRFGRPLTPGRADRSRRRRRRAVSEFLRVVYGRDALHELGHFRVALVAVLRAAQVAPITFGVLEKCFQIRNADDVERATNAVGVIVGG